MSAAGDTAMSGPAVERSRSSGPAIFGRRYSLGSLFGFEIGVDSSWIFIAVLITWSLATGWFPVRHPALSPALYWAMGVVGALGLFASVVLHELSHSLVARRHGMEMRGITLFIFGGVAHMGTEPPTPRAEFLVAIAGPIASLVLGGAFHAVGRAAVMAAAPEALSGVLVYLGTINLVLAAFNLVPAFPLDGGRVLRAILWHLKRSLRWATRVTSIVGAGFGIALIALGIVAFIGGQFIGGMWWALIGFFLRGAARMSYQQLVVREALAGEPVRRFMNADPRTVPPDLPLRTLVEEYFYRDYHKMYPVVEEGRLVGCVAIPQIRGVPREDWDRRTVGEVTTPCTTANTVHPDTDAVQVLGLMQREGSSRVMVVEDGRLVGILTLKDLLRFLAVKVELDRT